MNFCNCTFIMSVYECVYGEYVSICDCVAVSECIYVSVFVHLNECVHAFVCLHLCVSGCLCTECELSTGSYVLSF